MASVFTVTGVGAILEVNDDSVAITPKGLLGVLNRGLKGTKTIPFTSITAIQLKKAGLTAGYIQFTLPGGNESRSGINDAFRDENSFAFSLKENETVQKIKEYIEKRMRELRQPQPTQAASVGPSSGGTSIADALIKLAEMKSQGLLSDDEFAAAKKRILS